MSMLGFFLVVLAGGAAGLSAAGENRRALRQTEEAIRMVDSLRFFICVRRLTLPEAINRLGESFCWIIRWDAETEKQLREDSFSSLWKKTVKDAEICLVSESILIRIGEELSDGEDPERAFSSALSELKAYRDDCLARGKETGKLYPVVGLSVGCLIGLLLL